MGAMAVTQEMLAAKFGAIFPHLDERQRRLLIGAEARAVGHGGIRLVARAAGVREATVSLGVSELEAGAEPLGRARRPGGAASGRLTWTLGCARHPTADRGLNGKLSQHGVTPARPCRAGPVRRCTVHSSIATAPSDS